MIPPLASRGKGLHSIGDMRFFLKPFAVICLTLLIAGPAHAQSSAVNPPQPRMDDGIPDLPPPDILPDIDPDADDAAPAPPIAPTPTLDQPDYSRLSSKAERAARLSEMFERLGKASNSDEGDLITEEIYALWLDSGSASVNLVLRRGGAAHKASDLTLARVFFDHVTTLEPHYAEGWARSARLALEEREFERAVSESVTALTYEPRHFYALWTLGNVLERLGRADDALEAYQEAVRLHPQLTAVTERITALERQLGGGVL